MNQTTPLEFAVRQGADAMTRFPTDSYEDKERRALKAALNVAELRSEFSLTAATCAPEDARGEFCQHFKKEGCL